jgi:hypothetical protein
MARLAFALFQLGRRAFPLEGTPKKKIQIHLLHFQYQEGYVLLVTPTVAVMRGTHFLWRFAFFTIYGIYKYYCILVYYKEKLMPIIGQITVALYCFSTVHILLLLRKIIT